MGNCDFITRKVPEEESTIAKNIFYQNYVIGKGGYRRVK